MLISDTYSIATMVTMKPFTQFRPSLQHLTYGKKYESMSRMNMVDQSALRSQLDAIQTMTAMIVEKPKVVNKFNPWHVILNVDPCHFRFLEKTCSDVA